MVWPWLLPPHSTLLREERRDEGEHNPDQTIQIILLFTWLGYPFLFPLQEVGGVGQSWDGHPKPLCYWNAVAGGGGLCQRDAIVGEASETKGCAFWCFAVQHEVDDA